MRLACVVAMFVAATLNTANAELNYDRLCKQTQGCVMLASIVEAEAGGEGWKDKLAVAYTVVERKKSDSYPDTVGAVVKQKGQYTKPKKATQESKKAAYSALKHKEPNPAKGATHFHKKGVKPEWSRKMKRTLSTKKHVYMKENR